MLGLRMMLTKVSNCCANAATGKDANKRYSANIHYSWANAFHLLNEFILGIPNDDIHFIVRLPCT